MDGVYVEDSGQEELFDDSKIRTGRVGKRVGSCGDTLGLSCQWAGRLFNYVNDFIELRTVVWCEFNSICF